MGLIRLENLEFSYFQNNKKLDILKDINLDFEKGKLYAVIGESGSGKTTTLSLLGALDSPQNGKILYNNVDIKKIGYTKYRRNSIALVFQNYNLIRYMNAIENVVAAMEIKGVKGNKKQIAIDTLKKLGIAEDDMRRSVLQLSGGQQQRVAIARALVKDTDIILADEPTGNLDEQTSSEIMDILVDLARTYKKCVIIVTHSNLVSSRADIVYRVSNKNIQSVVKA